MTIRIATRFRLLLIAFGFEIVVTVLALSKPLANAGWFVPFLLFVAPGSVFMFFVGGGQSATDGLSPDWRMTLALLAGFLLNLVIMYAFCLLVRKVYREVKPAFKWKGLN